MSPHVSRPIARSARVVLAPARARAMSPQSRLRQASVIRHDVSASVRPYDVDTRSWRQGSSPPDSRQSAQGFVDFAVLDDSHCFLPQHSRPRSSLSVLRARQRTGITHCTPWGPSVLEPDRALSSARPLASASMILSSANNGLPRMGSCEAITAANTFPRHWARGPPPRSPS